MKSRQILFNLMLIGFAVSLSSCTQPESKVENVKLDPKEASAQHARVWQEKNKSGLDKLSKNDLDGAEADLVAGLKEAEMCGKDDARVAVSLNNLASLYENKKMYSQCTSYLRESRKIFRKWYGDNNASVFVTERNEARVLTKQDKWAEAIPLYEEVIKGMKALHANDLSDVEKELAEAKSHAVSVKGGGTSETSSSRK